MLSAGQATAMVIGGGQWQVAVIRRARELGLFTVVTDRSAEAPGRAVADRFFHVDAGDYQALLAIARQCSVDLVIAEATDRHVPAAAFLNQQLGLPGIMPDTARRFTNKYVMRQALREAALPMPRYAEISAPEEAEQFARSWGYPVVLKPKAAQSSLGVYRIDRREEIAASFARTMAESTDGTILIEEFIEGPEITVEAFSVRGKCFVLAISEKEHYAHNPCVARRLAYPPRYAAELLDAITTTAESVVEALGLCDGLSHAEYRLRDGKPFLIEVAARGGGNAIASTIVPHVSGVAVYDLLFKLLLRQPVAMPERRQRAAVLQFLDLPAGTVSAIRGIDQIREEGLAQDFRLYFSAGDTISAPVNDTARVGYFITVGDTRAEVDQQCARVTELLKIVF